MGESWGPSKLMRQVPKTSGLGRIEIWRNEVASSPIYCMCSALSMELRIPGSRGSWYRAKFAGTFHAGRKEDSSSSALPVSRPTSSKSDCAVCPLCASPVGGIEYKKLSSDGYGFVWAKNSPWSSANGKFVEDKGKRNSLLTRASQAFRRTHRLGSQRNSDPVEFTGGTNVLRALEDRMVRPQKSDSGWGDGTEMYGSLRVEAANNDGEDDGLGAFSDGDGKKLETSINESAARLRRALALLNKGGGPKEHSL
ncbi:hypothetical protein NUW58_g6366 [Xylaria curta]|uniref:Uncharacterized protein n=1 Tax=Xylaria curta TaxID=42375 RepID=A0ACC1NU08_9PEZI|nr:hypothetical protein NUW58_g6366 [Xylaria curta]